MPGYHLSAVNDLDDCPNPTCDARIESSGAVGEGDQEQGVCPTCGKTVRRRAGEPWMEATGPGADVS
jgi:hypothetical protein